MTVLPRVVLGLTLFYFAAGCGGKYGPPKYQRGNANSYVTYLQNKAQSALSFRSGSIMTYWTGKKKTKGKVLVQGQRHRKLRFNAEGPGGQVLVDLACDGTNFVILDQGNNCQRSGPITRNTIARLLRIELEPEDFLNLAVGLTPIIAHSSSTARWDATKGREIIELKGVDHAGKPIVQTIVLDGHDKRWDVLESTVRDQSGNIEWKLTNAEFYALTTANGMTWRVPLETQFQQPKLEANLLVDWLRGKNEPRSINLKLPPQAFRLTLSPSIPQCP